MLPTKGYFQDIECPFNNTTCGRPYCHFRHKRKLNENVEDNVQDTTKNVVPTYKPTPKSELANIHNNRSHIPISYVPDLAFKRERTARPITRIEKPTYKPTPLSILSSANKLDTSLPENHEHKETIKDIQDNIASNVYDPLKSEINFEDLSNEFDLIDDIINDTKVEPASSINDNLIKLENDIEKEQNKLNLLQSELSTSDLGENDTESFPKTKGDASIEKSSKLDSNDKVIIKKEKLDDRSSDKEKKEKSSDKESKSSSKDKSKVSNDKHKVKDKSSSSKERTNKELSKEKEKTSTVEKISKSHKSSEREKHRKEEKKNSSKESKESSKEKHKNKQKGKDRSRSPKESKKDTKSRHRRESGSNSESVSKDRSRSPKESKKDTKSRHRKESGSNSESISKDRKKSKYRSDSASDSESTSRDSSVEKNQKTRRKDKDNSKSKKRKSREKSQSKTNKEKNRKSREESTSRSRSRSISKSKESKSKHKTRRSASKSRHKEKDKKRSRSREKEKEKRRKSRESIEKKDRAKSSSIEKDKKSHSKKSHDDKKEKRKKSSSESNISRFDNDSDIQPEDDPMGADDLIPSDIDLDLEDEDETMRECYKIFNEYKPMPIQTAPKVGEVEEKDLFEDDTNLFQVKKRVAHAGAEISSTYSKLPPPPKPKTVPLPGQMLANRYKIAQLAQGNNEQENIMNEVKNMTQANKRPATSLLEAARQHKMKKLQQQKSKEMASVNVVDNILNGIHTSSPSQVKIAPKKIAAVPNIALIQKAKERISLIKQNRMQSTKTVAQTQKSGRVAHVPEFSLSDIPDVLQADKSKLPVNVRSRFLTMIADECCKLYALKQDAYNRALNEEFACYEKCKVLATYRNSAMLAVNRLRKEIQDREVKGLGRLLSGESSVTEKESDFKGKRFYEHVKRWILTEEELDLHGYPRESGERGKAIINNRKPVDYSITDDTYRKCSRCSRIYQVDDDGWPLYEEECMYHPLKKRTIRGEQVFLCCKSSDDTGCATSDTHVFDGLQEHLLEGYQTTLPPEKDDDPRNTAVYALDCEMCYTTKGLELTRVTIVDIDSKTVYESFVKPLNPIIDYNTRFSGITKDQMDRTSTSILQIQANILHLCNSETILVGHSLESDMKALKIVHGSVIDTSVLFPHKMGLPHKRALKALASEYLKKIIQNDVGGHDSAEDAITCMELIRWKLKEELKVKTK